MFSLLNLLRIKYLKIFQFLSYHQQVATNPNPFLLFQTFQLQLAMVFPIPTIFHCSTLPHYPILIHRFHQTQTLVHLLLILRNSLFYFLESLDFFISFIQDQIPLLKIKYLISIRHEMSVHQLPPLSSPKHKHHVSIGIHTYSHNIINSIMNLNNLIDKHY